MKTLATIVAAALALGISDAGASAIHQCADPSGTKTFTDQPCDRMGMVYTVGSRDQVRKRPGRSAIPSLRHGNERSRFGIGCPARSPQTLVGAVKTALDSGNVNELAGLYDWNGMSRGRAMEQMNRLTRIAQRPAMEVMLDSGYTGYGYTVTERDGITSFEGSTTEPASPVVRIDQYAADGEDLLDTTRFGITQDAGCMWLSFNE